jgi:hypothetical protein
MPYVDDATEAAFIAADKESEKEIERFCKEQGISPASMAFAFGFRAGFRTAHPTWQAILAKRKAFAESPEGRARRAWIDMVIAANKLIAKGRAPPLDEGEEDEDEDENENENVENENDENEGGPPPVKVPPNSRDKDKPEAVHVATAAEILRAGAVRRGEVTDVDNTICAQVRFSRHLNFRVFQQYPSTRDVAPNVSSAQIAVSANS